MVSGRVCNFGLLHALIDISNTSCTEVATKNFKHLDMVAKGYHKPADEQENWGRVPVSANSGSKQLYQLDDNTITMVGLPGKIRLLDKCMEASGLSLSTDSYDPAMLDRF